MSKSKLNMDNLFDKARKEEPVISMEDARNLLNQADADAAKPNTKKGDNIMNIIVSASAVLAAVSLIGVNLMNNNKINQGDIYFATTEQVQSQQSTNSQQNPDNVPNGTTTEHKGNTILLKSSAGFNADVKNNDVDFPVNKKIPEIKPVDVKGVNIIELTPDEFSKLGIVVSYDNNYDMGPAVCFLDSGFSGGPSWVTCYEKGGVSFNAKNVTSEDLTLQYIGPTLITDNAGNRRMSILRDNDSKLIESNSVSSDKNKKNIKINSKFIKIASTDPDINIDSLVKLELKRINVDSIVNSVSKNPHVYVKTLNNNIKIKTHKMTVITDSNSTNSTKLIENNEDINSKNPDLPSNDMLLDKRITKQIKIEIINGKDSLKIDDSNMNKLMKDVNDRLTNINDELDKAIKINKLVPIVIPMGKNLYKNEYNNLDDFAFIFWFAPTPELLSKLPDRVREKLEPEIKAMMMNTTVSCENSPIKGEDTYLDIWRACSGAVENMRVYPNPAKSNININYSLAQERTVTITLHDLSGKKITDLLVNVQRPAGEVNEALLLKNIQSGIYLVSIITEKGEKAVQRLVVEQ